MLCKAVNWGSAKDVQEAYIRSYMVEQSASVQLQLLSASGGALPTIPSEEECLFHRRSYEGYEITHMDEFVVTSQAICPLRVI